MKKINIIISTIFFIFVLLSITACTTSTSENKYGEKVQYSKDQVLDFSDFSVCYMGKRKIEVPQYAQGYFTYYDFEISDGSEKKIISWSSGTGSIAPVIFKFNNKDFVLEKGASDILGNLLNNEIVVWPKRKYDSKL